MNKNFRRFIRKNYYFDELKYKLELEFDIRYATNNWLNIYEIFTRRSLLDEDGSPPKCNGKWLETL